MLYIIYSTLLRNLALWYIPAYDFSNAMVFIPQWLGWAPPEGFLIQEIWAGVGGRGTETFCF